MEACIWVLSPLSLLPSSQAQVARTHLISRSGETARVPKLKQLSSPDSPLRCSQTALLPSYPHPFSGHSTQLHRR